MYSYLSRLFSAILSILQSNNIKHDDKNYNETCAPITRTH